MVDRSKNSEAKLSEWMKVTQIGQLTRDASLKTKKEIEADRELAKKVAELRDQESA